MGQGATSVPRAEERLRHALALLSSLEWNDFPKHPDTCPICGWPKGGHHGTRHEPGCSLERVLTNRRAYRLLDLEERYGDAAYGADGLDRRRHATVVVLWPKSKLLGRTAQLVSAGKPFRTARLWS